MTSKTMSNQKLAIYGILAGLLLLTATMLTVMHTLTKRHGSASAEAPGLRLPGGIVKAPIDLSQGVPTVQVWINECGPYTFLVDTASASIHVSQELADDLDLPRTGATMFRNAIGESIESPTVGIESIRVGDAVFPRWEAISRPFDDGRGPAGSQSVASQFDGILGYCLFRGCLLTIDFPAMQLVIQRGQLPPADGRDILVLVGGRSTPMIPLDVAGRQVNMHIDTGGNMVLSLPTSIASKLPLSTSRVKAQTRIAGGLVVMNLARLNSTLRIGRHSIPDPVIFYHDEMAGAIGMGVLRHFVVTFDSTGQRVRFSRAGAEPISIPGTRGLAIQIELNVEDQVATVVKIDSTVSGSDPDVRVGDRVLAMNGRPIEEFDVKAFRALFDACDTVELELIRGGNRLSVTMPVVELP